MADDYARSDEFRLGSRGREEAAALTWNWQAKPSDRESKRATVRRKQGALQSLVGYAAAGGLTYVGHPTLAMVAGGIATMILLLALLSPLGAYAALERGLTTFGRGVGLVVGWLALMPVFVLFFMPFGLLFRRGAKDPMKRQFDAAMTSYWREREPDADVLDRRKRQF